MTIALSNSNPVQYLGNGTSVTFSFPWKIFAATDLVVGFIVGGIYTQETSGFTVSGVGVNGGGSVTFTTAPPLNTTVDLRPLTPETQPTEFANLAAYLPENTTNGLDRLTRALQDLARQTLTFNFSGPDQEIVPWTPFPAASVRANTLPAFDANGLPTLAVIPATAFTLANFNAFLGIATWTQAIYNAIQAFAPVPVSPYFFKPATTSRTSTTTLTNDPDLVTGTLAPGVYKITLNVSFSNTTSNTQGFKFAMAYTGSVAATPNQSFGYLVQNYVFTTNFTVNGGAAINGAASSTSPVGPNDGLSVVYVAQFTTAGVLSLQWAQESSSPNATNVGHGSSMVVEKIA